MSQCEHVWAAWPANPVVCTECGIKHQDFFRIAQPCRRCLGETKNKKECPGCGTPVAYAPPPKKARPKQELEGTIKERIRAAVIAEGCLCWVHTVDNRNIRTGLGIGTADLICVVPPNGRFLGIEIKRPKYSPSDVSHKQRNWLEVVRKFGGVTGIATNVEEALALIQECRQS